MSFCVNRVIERFSVVCENVVEGECIDSKMCFGKDLFIHKELAPFIREEKAAFVLEKNTRLFIDVKYLRKIGYEGKVGFLSFDGESASLNPGFKTLEVNGF